MQIQIKRHGKVVETFATMMEASVAYWHLTAHELRNNRPADYEFVVNNTVYQPEAIKDRLQSRAIDTLKQHEVM